MNLELQPLSIPLRDDGQGGLRVGETRVNFESVWHTHQQGARPEEIVQAFDTLNVADVYTVLAWALRHPQEVQAYLKRRETEAAALRQRLEEAGLTPSRDESAKLQAKLMTRYNERQRQRAGDAALSDG